MDSTSVALLAQDRIGSGAAEGPLHTLSLVYDRLPQLRREQPYLDLALQKMGGARARRIPADDLLHFDAFADAPPHEEPYSGLWALQMVRPMIAATAEVEADTMLTGLGADEIHDVQPYYLADLLRQGRLFKAWREAGRWARARNGSRWNVFRAFGVGALGWPWSAGPGRNRARLKEQTLYSVPPWVLPAFARKYELHRLARANLRQTYRRCPNTTLSATVSGLASRPGDFVCHALAAPLGFVVAHPFLDSRLLALGLGIQSRIPPDPARMKPLLAEALRGILPEEIRLRRAKGCFDETYYPGLARNLPYLEAMVQNAPLEGLEMFDKSILTRQLEEASLGGANCIQVHRLNLTLSLIKWLCMQEQGQRNPLPPTEVIQV